MNHSADHQDMQSFPYVSVADEKPVARIRAHASSATVSLDTSAVRRQLSDLQFDSTSELKSTRRQAKSASDIILLRNSSTDATKPQCFTPKPKVQKFRRRKQEFDQLLQTPPYSRQNDNRRVIAEHLKSEADSGFGSCCESANSAVEAELKLLTDGAVMRSRTPPHQIRVRSSIGDAEEMVEAAGGGVDAEEDVNMMLFTPFKLASGSSELPELSPDIELSTSIVAGSESWVSFTPISTGARARTSTPCRLLGTDNQSKHPSSRSDSRTAIRLSHLLSEFSDDGLCSFDGVTGGENMPTGDPTSSGICTLDEVFELDVVDFSELQ